MFSTQDDTIKIETTKQSIRALLESYSHFESEKLLRELLLEKLYQKQLTTTLIRKNTIPTTNQITTLKITETIEEENKKVNIKFQQELEELKSTFDDDDSNNLGTSNFAAAAADEDKSMTTNFGVAYQMDYTNNLLFSYRSSLLDAGLKKTSLPIRQEHNISSIFSSQSLIQIPNSHLIVNATRKFLSEEGSITLYHSAQDRFNVLHSEPTKLSSLVMSFNEKRTLLAGLPQKGVYHYQLWKLSQHKKEELKLHKKSKWIETYSAPCNIPMVYDVDIDNNGTRILTLDQNCVFTIVDVDTDAVCYRSPWEMQISATSACRWIKNEPDKLLLFSGMSCDLRVFDAVREEYVQVLERSKLTHNITVIDIASDGKIALGMGDRCVLLYDYRTNKTKSVLNPNFNEDHGENLFWPLNGMKWNTTKMNQIMTYVGKKMNIIDLRAIKSCDELLTPYSITSACFLE